MAKIQCSFQVEYELDTRYIDSIGKYYWLSSLDSELSQEKRNACFDIYGLTCSKSFCEHISVRKHWQKFYTEKKELSDDIRKLYAGALDMLVNAR